MATEKKDIMERVKTFEDALAITGRPALPTFEELPEELRPYFQAQYKLVVIAEVLNEGWTPDWANWDEYKYYPWFDYDKSFSRFAFCGTIYVYSLADAGCASRLCYRTRALAKYSGEQFLDIWNNLILK